MNNQLIALAVGGTGGHIFPAEALAKELLLKDYDLVIFTDTRGYSHCTKIFDAPVYCIRAGSPFEKKINEKITGVIETAIGIFQTVRLLNKLKPGVVVGFGAYPTFPTMLASLILKIPSIVHEQNAILGRVNRVLSKRVDAIGLSFLHTKRLNEDLKSKAKLVGNPVRTEFLNVRSQPYIPPSPGGPVNLLVLGGSQGAAIFSDIVPTALKLIKGSLRARLRVTQQCRPELLEESKKRFTEAGIEAELSTFFDDIPALLRESHLVICRSGASTVAELQISGRPAVLVPYPYAVDDHQTENAKALDSNGCSWIIPQSEFTPENLSKLVEKLFGSSDLLKKTAHNCHLQGKPESVQNLVKLIEKQAGSVRYESGEPSNPFIHNDLNMVVQ